jgi:hypothetical protein
VVDHQDFVNQIKALLPDWVNHTSRRKKKEQGTRNKEEIIVCWNQQTIKTLELQSFLEFWLFLLPLDVPIAQCYVFWLLISEE